MSEKLNDGGSAFPFIAWASPSGMIGVERQGGMSLRDYFAAIALPVAWDALDKGYFDATDYTLATAEAAYQMADAMLKARER